MAEFTPAQVLHGNGGMAWFNGMRLATLQSAELKVTGDFEEFNVCDDRATYSVYNGYSGEGSLVFLKVNSDILKMLAQAYQTGEMPEITVITRLKQSGTNKTERVAANGVTVTEFMLAKFEKKTKIEEEVPFKFSNFELLDTI